MKTKQRTLFALLVFVLCAVLCVAFSLTAGAAEGDVEISEANFPDAKFRTYISTNFDKNGDNVLSAEEIAAVTNINVYNKAISDLTGINHFTSLTTIYCYNNSLTSLDVSALTSLTYLNCNNNSLTSLDVSGLTELTMLYCDKNSLTSLDVSGLTKLTSLHCDDNSLTSLDVSALTSLTYLRCDNNSLTSLDVSGLTKLTKLYCSGNKLTSLDISNNTSLNNVTVEPQTRDITVNCETMTYTMPAGFDSTKVTSVTGGTFNGDVLTVNEGTTTVTYTYNTGREDKPLEVTLNITYIHNFTYTYVAGSGEHTATCSECEYTETVSCSYISDCAIFCTVCGKQTRNATGTPHNYTSYTNLSIPSGATNDTTQHNAYCSACQRAYPAKCTYEFACSKCKYCGGNNSNSSVDHTYESDYVVKDDTYHTKHCTVCGYDATSKHFFLSNEKCLYCPYVCSHSSITEGKCDKCPKEFDISVTVNNKVTYYTSFTEAIASVYAMRDHEVFIKLLKNISVNEPISSAATFFYLDLNGKILEFATTGGDCWTHRGNLFIKDTSAEQTGKIYCSAAGNENYALISISDNANLILESGTIDGSQTKAAITTENGASIVQSGGVIKNTVYLNYSVYKLTGGTLEATGAALKVYGFDISSDIPWNWDINNPYGNYDILITGGTITAGSLVEYLEGSVRNPVIKITGGTFTNGLKISDYSTGEALPLASVLPHGYAFCDADGSIITLAAGQAELTGAVSAKACTHPNGTGYEVYEDGHAQKCEICGIFGTKEAHTFAPNECACGEKKTEASQVSLTLDGDIGVNFYWLLADNVISDPTAYFLVNLPNGGTERFDVSAMTTVEKDGTAYYRVTGRVAAKEMADDVVVELYAGGELIKSANCSVRGYAERAFTLAASDPAAVDAKLITMMKAMLNYGAASQMLLGYNTSDLANSILADGDTTVAAITANDVSPVVKSGSVAGITPTNFSCILETKTTLRHYFTVEGGSIEGYTFKVGNTEVEPKLVSGNTYCVDIENISAADLGTAYTFTVTDGTTTQTITASVESYMNSVIVNKDNTALVSPELLATVYAMHAYGEAATTYFN